MSRAELNDVQLDGLLGQVPPPQAPSAALAERIGARAASIPQTPTPRFAVARRHGLRRHPFVWSTVIAANALAAAAAASTWDGQRFDFHRLADIPHKVAAAIHLPHRHAHEPERHVHLHQAVRAVPVARVAPTRLAATPVLRRMPALASGPVKVRPEVSNLRPHRTAKAAIGKPAGIVAPHRPAGEGTRAAERLNHVPALRHRAVQDHPAQARADNIAQKPVADRPVTSDQTLRGPEPERALPSYSPPRSDWNRWRPAAQRDGQSMRMDGRRRWQRWRREFPGHPQRGMHVRRYRGRAPR